MTVTLFRDNILSHFVPFVKKITQDNHDDKAKLMPNNAPGQQLTMVAWSKNLNALICTHGINVFKDNEIITQ